MNCVTTTNSMVGMINGSVRYFVFKKKGSACQLPICDFQLVKICLKRSGWPREEQRPNVRCWAAWW